MVWIISIEVQMRNKNKYIFYPCQYILWKEGLKSQSTIQRVYPPSVISVSYHDKNPTKRVGSVGFSIVLRCA